MQFLLWASYTHNYLHYSATHLTPFQCVLGYQMPLFPWDALPTGMPAVDEWFKRTEQVWESVINVLKKWLKGTSTLLTVTEGKLPNTTQVTEV